MQDTITSTRNFPVVWEDPEDAGRYWVTDLQHHAYLQCALKSARKLAVSPDSAEQVAHTAMASCSPERQAFILAVARASDPTFASRHWEVTQPDIRRIVAKHVTEQRQFMTGPGRVSRGSNAPEHRPA